jgi:hypothetical protein
MARPDAARLIARNLHSLPHPNGSPIKLMQFSAFGQHPQAQAKHRATGDLIGDATIHLLEREGFQITHRDDPKPADKADYKTAIIKCLRCGKQLLALGVDENMTATMSRLALRSLATINPECPHE